MNNKLKIIFSSILLFVVLLMLFFNKISSLEILKNTSLNDDSKIQMIFNKLDYKDGLLNYSINDNKIDINYELEIYNYKTLEYNASILFYLINNLEQVSYKVNDNNYVFERNKIEKIYNNFDDIKIKDIDKRYKGDYFDKIYLGNIDGQINLFDISDLCLEEYVEIYRDDKSIYYVTCSAIDDIILVKGNEQYGIIEALKKEIVTIDQLFETNLKIKVTGINDENISE